MLLSANPAADLLAIEHRPAGWEEQNAAVAFRSRDGRCRMYALTSADAAIKSRTVMVFYAAVNKGVSCPGLSG
jgi:hypothetical protein